MRRLARFVLRNWPLKLGAVLLATVLYSGLVLSQNVRTWTGTVSIVPVPPHPSAALLAELPPVTHVRFRAPLDVGVLSPASFQATVDLSAVRTDDRGPVTATVPVTLVALDNRIQIVDFQPQTIQVQLDPVVEATVPVDVEVTAPPDVQASPAEIAPAEVTVRGASSLVQSVVAADARVAIDATGINVDRVVELIPVDAVGNEVGNVDLDPEFASIKVAVARQLDSRQLPVVVDTAGELAPGYEIADVTADPVVVTVSGERTALAPLTSATTAPLDLAGRGSGTIETTLPLVLPDGVAASGPGEVEVSVTIVARVENRTYSVAVVPDGARPDRTYTLGAPNVSVTLAGPAPLLEELDASQLRALAAVGQLDVGRHTVPLDVAPPAGLELVSVAPAEVVVEVAAPLETPLASPTVGLRRPSTGAAPATVL